MSSPTNTAKRFGTAPVFLAAISTILGAVLFLRFGYAVGHVGLFGAIGLVLIGHAITIPTGLAIAEIATNLKVEGGGEYYIISRSFGTTVGGAIGVSLYLSQAVSVAFYLIAFSESFTPLFPIIEKYLHFTPDVRMFSIPFGLILTVMILRKGANIGVTALWVVVGILGVSLAMFFLGNATGVAPGDITLLRTVDNPHGYFFVFAIIFPAFTGMTAGVGLSGDLRNPRKSIPLGTMAATLTGMVVYILIVIKLSASASPEEMATDQFVMSRIALWGPIIPIGLAAATISSVIGSILVAPRTLQALAGDNIFPISRLNKELSSGKGASNEPVNATIVTAVIAFVFVAHGNVDFVAQIISMFFMITYGALCSISFLEHFAGNPSYRPTFRTKWYLSLIGAVASFFMMFQMQPFYALLAIVFMSVTYMWLNRSHVGERDLSAVMKGVLFQMTRQLQVLIQRKQATVDMSNWRPSFIAISKNTFSRLGPFDLLRWITHYYGFGSFIHFIQGPLNRETNRGAEKVLQRLIEQVQASGAGMYVDTIISPSFTTAVAQIVQTPGIAGMDNNSVLFEFPEEMNEDLQDILNGCRFAAIAGFNICILRSTERHFGYHSKIHIWLTPGDLRNANLMIILAYIILGHPEWKRAEIKLFTAFDPREMIDEKEHIKQLVAQGRILISSHNVQMIPVDPDVPFGEFVSQHSDDADLVITGFSLKKMRKDSGAFLKGFSKTKDILFVRAGQDILITQSEDDTAADDDVAHEEPKIVVDVADTDNLAAVKDVDEAEL